jgi:hypothetical protein
MTLSGNISDADRLPHDQAVWRDYDSGSAPVRYEGAPPPGAGDNAVSVDFGNGQIVISYGHLVRWHGAKRWRFGWPPR